MIYGEKVKQARELRGLTQKELAERVGLSQPTIASVESGTLALSDEKLAAIALQTAFPVSFFKESAPIDFPQGSLLFRSRASLTAHERVQGYRYAQTMFEFAVQLSQKIRPIPVRIPQLDDTWEAPAATRASLGLSPDRPIPDLVSVLERAGVVVLALPLAIESADAFSVWVGPGNSRPVIAFSAGKTGDRLRFSMAHELGHLVLHQRVQGSVTQLEEEADRFAGEFLMPEAAMKEAIVPPVTLGTLAALKPRWRVSMQALAMRAKELGIITDRQAKYLFQQISKRGWRLREPSNLDVPVEKPRSLAQMAEMIYGTPLNYRRIAAGVHLSSQLVGEFLSNYDRNRTGVPSSSGSRNGNVIQLRPDARE